MKRFKLVGLKPPGTVNIQNLGTIDLEKIDDDLAEKLYLGGNPYIMPVIKVKTREKNLPVFTDDIALPKE